jgi:hypothetical protein
MKKQSKAKTKSKAAQFLTGWEPNAAGIDLAANEIWVAVPETRASEPIRRFGAYTAELKTLLRLAPGLRD